MSELLKGLVFTVIMVPVVMAVVPGLIYDLGKVSNIFSGVDKEDQPGQNRRFPECPLSWASSFSQLPAFSADIFSYLPHKGWQ